MYVTPKGDRYSMRGFIKLWAIDITILGEKNNINKLFAHYIFSSPIIYLLGHPLHPPQYTGTRHKSIMLCIYLYLSSKKFISHFLESKVHTKILLILCVFPVCSIHIRGLIFSIIMIIGSVH